MSKFCSNCGKEIKGNVNFCPECGKAVNPVVEETPVQTTNTTTTEKTNALAVSGFVVALVSLLLNFWGIVGIIATVLSGVGLSQTGPGKDKGRGLAIAGLSIGIFSILYGVFQIMAIAMRITVLPFMGL